MGQPLFWLSIFLALGALTGPEIDVPQAWALAGLAALLLPCASGARAGRLASAALLGAAFALGAATAGVERAEHARTPLSRWLAAQADPGPVHLFGWAAADARAMDGRWLVLVDVERLVEDGVTRLAVGRVRLTVGGRADLSEILQGDGLDVWATLRRPRDSGEPAAARETDRTLRQGVHAVGYCKSARLLRRQAPRLSWRPTDWAARLRAHSRRILERYVPAGPERGVVAAMVLGDKTALDDDTSESFRIAGTYHVLAISGAQVALLAVGLVWLVKLLELPAPLGAAFVGTSLVAYALFVGADVPVVRAVIMATTLLLGRAIDLDADLVNLLGLAGAMILVVRPSDIRDPGFQLSFAATLGLVTLSRPVGTLLPEGRLGRALAPSAGAQLALAPLLLTWFHRLAPAALVLNLVAVPLSSLVFACGFGVLAASVVHPLVAGVVGDAAWLSSRALLWSGELVRGLPLLDARLPSPTPPAVALYVAGLVLWAQRPARRAGPLLTLLMLVVFAVGGGTPGDGRLHLTVLDVGQGDCLVLRSPAGRTWVVDSGGRFDRALDAGEWTVGPFLWDQGVRRIERLLVTHAHGDHVGAVPFLVRSLQTEDLWEGPAPRGDLLYDELQRRLSGARHLHRRTVRRGVAGDWDGVRFEILAPDPHGRPPLRTRNDDSVVLLLTYGKVRILLPGDLEWRGEAALGEVPADVLKVPHHGSRTSSSPAFLASVAPRVAVISVGTRNPFGHPHPEVVAAYLRAGVRLYRTDRDGTVAVSTDGRALWVLGSADPGPPVKVEEAPGL